MDTSRASRTKLTYEDFLLFPDDGRRHELINGEHYVTPSPNLWHQELLQRLSFAIQLYLRAHPGGRMFFAPLDCVFTIHDIVEPDLLVVLPDQLDILTEKNIQGPPALVAEILSPSTSRRDRGIKRALYERVGVREYWIVDPDRKGVQVLRRTEGKAFRAARTLTSAAGDLLTTPLLPGFSLSLAELFRSDPRR